MDLKNRRLSRRRLAPGGASGPDLIAWATRIGAVLVVLATALLLFAILRPLETFEGDAALAVLQVPEIEPAAAESWETRQQIVNQLSGNRFTNNPMTWGTRIALDPGSEDGDGDEKGAAKDSKSEDSKATAVPGRPGEREIRITGIEDMLPDTVDALNALRLSGIYLVDGNDRRGFTPGSTPQLAARINFLHAKRASSTAPFQSITVMEGDVFYDTHLKQEKSREIPWEVLVVDADADRVVLRRNDDNVILAMYDGLPVPAIVRTKMRMDDDRVFFKPEDVYVSGASVEELDNLLAALRNDGTLSPEDEAELAALMRDPMHGRTTVDTLLPESDDATAEGGKSDAPPDFPPELANAIRHMMSGGDPKDLERVNLANDEQPEDDDQDKE